MVMDPNFIAAVEDLYPFIALLAALGTAITAAAAGVRWLTKHYFDEIKAEFKPNGGSSMRDKVNSLETEQKRIYHKIEELEEKADKDHKELSEKVDNIYKKIIDILAK